MQIVKIPRFLTHKPPNTADLIGRERELREIGDLLNKRKRPRPVLVHGLGGVGKSELCKNFFWDSVDNYKHLAWVDFVGNIKESFVNAFSGASSDLIKTSSRETLDDQFIKIIRFLEQIDTDSLLVIDNLEVDTDMDMRVIFAFRFKVLVSSRIILEGFKKYELESLATVACKELFYSFYEGDKDDPCLENIIALVGNHTLTIELLARTAQNSWMSIRGLLGILRKRGFNLNKVISDHLTKIFDISNLPEDELYILTNLSVLPPMYISANEFSDWIDLEKINTLVKKGWLRRFRNSIFMHQVIGEVVRLKTTPNVEVCKNVIESLIRLLHLEPGENPFNKKRYIIFAESLLNHLTESLDERDNSLILATLLNNLPLLLLDLGEPEKALQFQERAFKIRNKLLDQNNILIAESYNNLSLIYKDLGRLSEALDFQQEALRIRQQVLDENNSELANSYNNLSLIYKYMGELEHAKLSQEKALEIRERRLKKDHPDLAQSYNNLSLIYRDLGKLEEALESQKKALKIRELVLEEDNPDLAQSYSNLALILKNLGKLDEALRNQEKALEIRRLVLGKDHPNLAQSYNNLAEIHRAMGNLQEALGYQERALVLRKDIFGENNSSVAQSYHNLSAIFSDMGKLEEALENQLKALKIKEKVSGKNHPDLASSYNNLAFISLDLKDYKSARQYIDKAVEILSKKYPRGHLWLEDVIANQGYIEEHIP